MLIFSFSLFGSEYHDHALTGERSTNESIYFGPHNPERVFDSFSGEIKFKDTKFQDEYLNDQISPKFFNLYDKWIDELPNVSSCPNFFFNKNINYIQYLYRLASISYLYELLMTLDLNLQTLSDQKLKCSTKWEDVFEKCQPQSKDMKLFIGRSKEVANKQDYLSKLKYMRPTELEKYINQIENENGLERAMAKYKNNQSTKESYIKSYQNLCDDSKKLINLFCSEKDSLYGASKVKRLNYTIQRSNAMSVINDGGHAFWCLKRYVNVHKNKEKQYDTLNMFFDLIFEKLQNEKEIQGKIFLSGALKEFDDKGLTDFLFEPPRPKKVIKVAKVQAPPLPKKEIVKPKIVKKVEKKVVPKKKEEPKKLNVFEKKISYFYQAYRTFIKSGASVGLLDMREFKKDFVFTESMVSRLDGPLSYYETRDAISDMRKYDRLGYSDRPMKLLILKFLIDQERHQGLFNLQAILGETFYIENDIDKISKPIHIRLENNEFTGFRWQISFLK